MEALAIMAELLPALAIGLLIGVERGWRSRGHADGQRVAGLRTFGLLGLLGGLAGILVKFGGLPVALLFLAGGIGALLLGYGRAAAQGSLSITNAIVALITLCLGWLAASDQQVVAVALGAAVVLLLSMRTALHGWVKGLTEAEVLAIARFALISLAVLPLLPDRAYGPYDAWNPRQIWFVVVLVSGFSLAGYVAAKRLGPARGPLVTAAAGAMVSSTAITVALAHQLRQGQGASSVPIAGIAIATVVMYLRVLLLTGLVAPFALPSLLLVLCLPTAVSVALAAWATRRTSAPAPAAELALGKPFALLPALGFAALVAVLSLASRAAAAHFGDAGLAVLLAISGSFDVDAAIVTLGGLPDGALEARLAGMVLAVPVLLNSLFKGVLALGIAPANVRFVAALPLVSSVLVGAASLLIAWRF